MLIYCSILIVIILMIIILWMSSYMIVRLIQGATKSLKHGGRVLLLNIRYAIRSSAGRCGIMLLLMSVIYQKIRDLPLLFVSGHVWCIFQKRVCIIISGIGLTPILIIIHLISISICLMHTTRFFSCSDIIQK